MVKLLKYLKKNKIELIISITSALISVTMSLLAPIIIGKAIDGMASEGNVDFQSIIKILILLAVVYILGSAFMWGLTYITSQISYKVANSIRKDLLEKINKLPLKFFDNNSHGDIISRFVNDVDAITDGMIQGVASLLNGIITILGAIGFMFYINPVMAVIVLLSAPFTYFVARFITKNSQKYFKSQADRVGELNGYVEEMISGQKTVKAFSHEEDSINNFKKINSELYKVGIKAQFFGAMANPATRLVNNIAYAVIGVSGSIIAILGNISIGDISSFLIYSNLFSKPFNEITGVLTQIQGAFASADRIFEILEIEEEKDEGSSKEIENIKGDIEFKNIQFSYTPCKKLITDFNLKVKAGSKVAIVGKTGCGKTTLVNLIMRFYNSDSGSIYIDGIDTKDMKKDNLRKNFGMVLQETFLFTDTIANNISYGKKDATIEEIIDASKKTGAHSFIRRLPNGYNTVISAEGQNLSVGQKQLLTITRVMLVDPPMLILDEATSNIDTRTELKIQKAFEIIMKGRTSFIIAHRLSTIMDADIILVMDNGNVAQKGNHLELINKKGIYRALWASSKEHSC